MGYTDYIIIINGKCFSIEGSEEISSREKALLKAIELFNSWAEEQSSEIKTYCKENNKSLKEYDEYIVGDIEEIKIYTI